jgi:hypothetical protein
VIHAKPGVHEIRPASLAQVMQGQDGRMVVLDDDAGNVAADLRSIDRSLRLVYSERGGHYVVMQIRDEPDGRRSEHLVTTALDCDQRLVERVRKITHPSYDVAAELAKGPDRQARERRRQLDAQIEAGADQLVHSLRKDHRIRDRIFVP